MPRLATVKVGVLGYVNFTRNFEAGLCHFLISECPSAKEKPHAPLWYVAGMSCQLFSAGLLMKKPSLMESGCSSRTSQVLAGLGTSVCFRNWRLSGQRFLPPTVGSPEGVLA